MKKVVEQLSKRLSLSRHEAYEVMDKLTVEGVDPEIASLILVSLNKKGESIDELVGFAQCLRAKALKVTLSPEIIKKNLMDVCGTGGDGKGTFNISTAVSFVVAAGGQPIAKHGNRSVSSRSGSFDVLEALQVPISSAKPSIEESLTKFNLCFLFAPDFHPALKNISSVRKNLGMRTVFNILGPLLNPVSVKRQVIGVFHPDLIEKMAVCLKELGSEEVIIVHGDGSLDEFSISGTNKVGHLKNGSVKIYELSPEDFGLKRSALDELRGGSPLENAEMIKLVLQGEPGPRQDIVVMNSAAALYVGGKAQTLKEGTALAKDIIESGRAYNLLKEMKLS